jgi:hypothetical protein
LNPEFHDEFVVLCALFYSGELSEEEWALLQIHMAYCDSCHERFLQYDQIKSGVIPAMAAVAASDVNNAPDESSTSVEAAEEKLMSKLDSVAPDHKPDLDRKRPWRIPVAVIAACSVGITCLFAAHWIRRESTPATKASHPTLSQQAPRRAAPNTPAPDSLPALEQAQDEIVSLKSQLAASESRFQQSSRMIAEIEKQLQAEQSVRKELSSERETLNQQLVAAQAEAESLRNKLVLAGTDKTEQATRVSSLEQKVRELDASLEEKDLALSEKDRMLDLDKDFLAHDRDIRDLIGARNLYIADISDTAENGATAKQFGRIFYTKDRSLVFYGFDLDSQAGHKQNVSFQVWGSGSDRSGPVSLGLFYQDDSHKRWVLRCNDAKTLARLDMVFVTVEPPGGSAKPTGKQLLRAYLQIQPNHP